MWIKKEKPTSQQDEPLGHYLTTNRRSIHHKRFLVDDVIFGTLNSNGIQRIPFIRSKTLLPIPIFRRFSHTKNKKHFDDRTHFSMSLHLRPNASRHKTQRNSPCSESGTLLFPHQESDDHITRSIHVLTETTCLNGYRHLSSFTVV